MSKKITSCVQFTIGNKKYKFEDVDVSSTSLDNILRSILSNYNNIDKINEIINTKTDINSILDDSPKSFTDVGDSAIGNLNLNGLNTLSILHAPIKGERLSSYTSSIVTDMNYLDNNILVSNNTESCLVYIGYKRAFITVNPNILKDPIKVSQLISLNYALNKCTNYNSPIFRTLKEYVDNILHSDSELYEELKDLDSSLAAKKLLLYAIQNQDKEISRNILNSIAKNIKQEAVSREKVKGLDFNSVKDINKYSNTTSQIGDHKYTNGFILKVLNDIQSGIFSEVDISKNTKFEESTNNSIKRYYLQAGEAEQMLLDDIYNLNPALLRESINDIKSVLINDYMYKDLSDVDISSSDIEVFTPLRAKFNIDPEYSINKQAIIEFDNKKLNKIINEKSLRIIFSETGKDIEFKPGNLRINIRTFKSVPNTILDKLYTNGTATYKNWFITESEIENPSEETLSYLNDAATTLFNSVNINGIRLHALHSTVHDDVSYNVAKIAHNNSIVTTLYPNYHPTKKNRREMNIDFSKDFNIGILSSRVINFDNPDNKEVGIIFNPNSKQTNKYNGKYGLSKNSLGDLFLINGKKKILSNVIKFKFKQNRDSEELIVGNRYKSGIVVSVKDGNNVHDGIILNSKEEDNKIIYNVKLSNSKIISVESKDFKPLYPSDYRRANSVDYIYNSLGLYKRVNNSLVKTTSLDDYYNYFSDELHNIFSKTFYSDYDTFLSEEFNNIKSFNENGFYEFSDPEDRTVDMQLPPIPNYSNVNVLEVLSNKISRQGIKVITLNSNQIKEKFGLEVSDKKAFVNNGMIVLNTDKYTEDSPIHELMHLLIAQLKISNYNRYKELLDEASKLTSYSDVKESYKTLSPLDLAEEVLVHAVSDYYLGRINDYGRVNIQNLDLVELTSELLNLNKKQTRANKDILNETLRTLLLESGDGSILKQLSLGINKSDIITNNRISTVKNDLIKNEKLKYECQ